MPYTIRKDGPDDKPWCVYNKETDKKMGCTTSEGKAKDMVKAIGANTHKSVLEVMTKELKAAWYPPYMGWQYKPKAAAAETEPPVVLKQAMESLNMRIEKICVAFDDYLRAIGQDPWDWWVMHVYEDDGTFVIVREYGSVAMYRVDYTETEDGFEFVPEVDWVEVVFVPVGAEDVPTDANTDVDVSGAATEGPSEGADVGQSKEAVQKESPMEMLRGLWRKVFGKTQDPPERTFLTLKQADGKYRWISLSSTAFLDRTKDIVTREGITKSLSRAPEVGLGPLLYWHERSIPVGSADFQLQEDAVLIESGCWDDTPLAQGVRKGIEGSKTPWGVSIGFLGLKGNAGVVKDTRVEHLWEDLQIVERSIVPEDRAAAHFSHILTKDGGTDMRTDKKEKLVELVGADMANKVEALTDDVNSKATAPDAIVKETPETPPEGSQAAVAAIVAQLKEVDPAMAERLEKAFSATQTPPVDPAKQTKADEPETDTPEDDTADSTSDDPKGLFANIAAMLTEVKEQLVTVQKEVKELKGEDAPKAFTGIPEGVATVQVKDQPVEGTEEQTDYPAVIKEMGGAIFQVHQGSAE